jgi:ubiquinone biosynthesis protein COQ4
MTTAIPPLPGRRFRPRAALASVRRLLEDPDDTERAIEVFYAIGRGEFERGFQRLCRDAQGRRLLRERPDLLARVGDRAALAALPADSLGRAYLAYLEANGFDPAVLVALNQRVVERLMREDGLPPLDPARAWWRDRTILAHDFAHVLTGQRTDDAGEASLLTFGLAQLPGLATGLLAAGATLEMLRRTGWPWLVHERAVWRSARRARWLAARPYEQWLGLPLARVRARTRLTPAHELAAGLDAGRRTRVRVRAR